MDRQPGSLDGTRERLADFWISPLEYKIVQIAGNDRVPVQDFGKVIAGESLLTVRLLRLGNLIAGLPQVLSTLAQFISILGVDHAKALALGLSCFSLSRIGAAGTKAESEVDSIVLRQMWEHSIGCAALAGRIAMKLGSVRPQSAFVAGFLHDIGRVVLYRYATEHYIQSTAVAMEKNIPLTEAETLACGLNHLQLGEIWSRKVELPVSLTAVIRHHHDAPRGLPDSITGEARRIITIVRLADLACERQGIGSGGDQIDGIGELYNACELQPQDMTDELQVVQREVEASRELFGYSSAGTDRPLLAHGSPMAGSLSRTEKTAANERRGRVLRFPARRQHPAQAGENSCLKRITILVVEDHGSLCEMLSLYLIRHGYHVRTADNGQAALDVLSKENVDLVLLDLMLPRMDGFAVLRRVREDREDAKPYIIVVSAGASEKDRSRVLELGANEYMPKPFHLIRLLERIQAVEKYLLS